MKVAANYSMGIIVVIIFIEYSKHRGTRMTLFHQDPSADFQLELIMYNQIIIDWCRCNYIIWSWSLFSILLHGALSIVPNTNIIIHSYKFLILSDRLNLILETYVFLSTIKLVSLIHDCHLPVTAYLSREKTKTN